MNLDTNTPACRGKRMQGAQTRGEDVSSPQAGSWKLLLILSTNMQNWIISVTTGRWTISDWIQKAHIFIYKANSLLEIQKYFSLRPGHLQPTDQMHQWLEKEARVPRTNDSLLNWGLQSGCVLICRETMVLHARHWRQRKRLSKFKKLLLINRRQNGKLCAWHFKM